MKTSQLTKLLALLIAVSFAFSSCEEDETMRGPKNLPNAAIENMGKPMDKGDKSAPEKSDISIIDIAKSDPDNFSTLLLAVENADPIVAETLANSDQYTVFAPTNDAFEDLFAALDDIGITTEVLLTDPDGLLTSVLLYHVTEGRRAANSVVPPVKPRTIETLLEDATFNVNSDGTIDAVGNDDISITAADISASNGIIHVIDEVLLPVEL